MCRWPSASVAVVTSALAIAINIATDLKVSWWPWLLVIALTAISAALTRVLQKHENPNPNPKAVQNYVDRVDGNVIQASEITGDITFGKNRSPRGAAQSGEISDSATSEDSP